MTGLGTGLGKALSIAVLVLASPLGAVLFLVATEGRWRRVGAAVRARLPRRPDPVAERDRLLRTCREPGDEALRDALCEIDDDCGIVDEDLRTTPRRVTRVFENPARGVVAIGSGEETADERWERRMGAWHVWRAS